MDVEIGQQVAPGYDLRRTGEGSHQLVQGSLHLQNDVRGALCNQWHVAAELDRVTQTLLGMEKNSLARDLIRPEPLWLCEISFLIASRPGFPSPFVLFPAAIKVTREQPAERFVVVRVCIVRPQGQCAVVARQRLFELP